MFAGGVNIGSAVGQIIIRTDSLRNAMQEIVSFAKNVESQLSDIAPPQIGANIQRNITRPLQTTQRQVNDLSKQFRDLVVFLGGVKLGQFAMETSEALAAAEIRFKSITGSQKNALDLMTRIRDRAREFGVPVNQAMDVFAGIAPLIKEGQSGLEDYVNVMARMAVLDPAQGLRGAAFAIREALSSLGEGRADFRSLSERFEISKPMLRSGLQATGGDLAAALDMVLDKMGITEASAREMANTVGASFRLLKDEIGRTLSTALGPFFNALVPILQGFNDFLQTLNEVSPETLRFVGTVAALTAAIVSMNTALKLAKQHMGGIKTAMLGAAGVLGVEAGLGIVEGLNVGGVADRAKENGTSVRQEIESTLQKAVFLIGSAFIDAAVAVRRFIDEIGLLPERLGNFIKGRGFVTDEEAALQEKINAINIEYQRLKEQVAATTEGFSDGVMEWDINRKNQGNLGGFLSNRTEGWNVVRTIGDDFAKASESLKAATGIIIRTPEELAKFVDEGMARAETAVGSGVWDDIKFDPGQIESILENFFDYGPLASDIYKSYQAPVDDAIKGVFAGPVEFIEKINSAVDEAKLEDYKNKIAALQEQLDKLGVFDSAWGQALKQSWLDTLGLGGESGGGGEPPKEFTPETPGMTPEEEEAYRKYLMDIQETTDEFGEKRADAEEKLGEKRLEIQQKYIDKAADLEAKRIQDTADAIIKRQQSIEDAWIDLIQTQEDIMRRAQETEVEELQTHLDELERIREDARKNIQKAARNLDAVAVADLKEQLAEEIQEREKSYYEKKQQEKDQGQEELAQAKLRFDRRVQELQRNFEREEQTRDRKLQRDLMALQDQQQKELDEAQKAYDKELLQLAEQEQKKKDQRTTQLTEELAELGNHYAKMIQEMKVSHADIEAEVKKHHERMRDEIMRIWNEGGQDKLQRAAIFQMIDPVENKEIYDDLLKLMFSEEERAQIQAGADKLKNDAVGIAQTLRETGEAFMGAFQQGQAEQIEQQKQELANRVSALITQGEELSTNANIVRERLGRAIAFTLESQKQFAELTKNTKPLADDTVSFTENLGKLANVVKTGTAVIGGILEAAGVNMSTADQNFLNFVERTKTFLQSVIGGSGNIIMDLVQNAGNLFNNVRNAVNRVRGVLGFKEGTNDVPATGLYMLHEGEAVLNKQTTDVAKQFLGSNFTQEQLQAALGNSGFMRIGSGGGPARNSNMTFQPGSLPMNFGDVGGYSPADLRELVRDTLMEVLTEIKMKKDAR